MEAPSGMGAPNPITPTKEQIKTQQRHTNVMVDVLTHLLGTPTGDLTKKDVFDGAADAIAKGAFPTPESQQQLIVEMANLPDDDPGLRKALSALLLQSATLKHVMAKTFGEG
jgi:hypothetical protein